MGNGLDTRGVVDGFAKGFGMVDRYYDKEEDRTRRTALDQERRDYRDQQQDNWQQSFDANADQREQQQSNWQATHDANQAQRNRSHALQIKQNEQSESHRQWSRDRGDEQDAVDARDRKHEQDLEYIKQAYNAATQGMPFDERFYETVSQPRYSSLDPRRLLDDQMGAAIDRGKRVMDPNDPADINDPESLEAINLLFDHDINSDRDGNPMDGKRRIAGIYPGAKEGTIAGELEMEDGRRVPMTENRGTEEEGDNTVLQQPVEMMIQKLASADMMRQFLQSPRGKAALVNMGRAQGLIAKADNKLDPRIKAQLDINKAKLTQLYKAMSSNLLTKEQSQGISAQIAQIDQSNQALLYGKPGNSSAPKPPPKNDGGRAIMEQLVSGEGVVIPGQVKKPGGDPKGLKTPQSAAEVKAAYIAKQAASKAKAASSAKDTSAYRKVSDQVANYLHTPESERDYNQYQQIEASLKALIDGDYPVTIRNKAVADYRQLLSGALR